VAAAGGAIAGIVGWRLRGDGDSRRLWEFPTPLAITSPPAVGGGAVYVLSGEAGLHAVDAATGQERWTFARDSWLVKAACAAGRMVYVACSVRESLREAAAFVALDAISGRQRWSLFTGEPASMMPAVSGGTLYVSGADERGLPVGLYALDSDTGTQRWHFSGPRRIIFDAPVVADGVVYFSAVEEGIFAVDAATGVQRWMRSIAGWSGALAVADRMVYVIVEGEGLLVLDAASGAERGQFRVPVDRSAVVVADGTVYFSGHDLYAVDAITGRQRWTFASADSIDGVSTPAVAGGVVYVGDSGALVALDAVTGERRWTYSKDDRLFYEPAVTDDAVYVCTTGALVALRR
jgi:outer membrane protein assembly factor BamB